VSGVEVDEWYGMLIYIPTTINLVKTLVARFSLLLLQLSAYSGSARRRTGDADAEATS
jgi:hypothetical protein